VYLTLCQKPAVGVLLSCSEVGVYDEPWPSCYAGVRTPRLTETCEALGAVTRMAHGTMALPACLDSGTAWVEQWEAKGVVLSYKE
jgi:hypothetical protein